MKENLHTKYTPFIYNDVALNEKTYNQAKSPLVIGGVEYTTYSIDLT